MERFDIAIVGTGPAGLEAAITASIRNKKLLLLGNKGLSDKIEKAHSIQNYLGLPEVSGEELKLHFQKHLEQMNIEITEERVNAIYAMGDYFAIQGHNDIYEAKTVILACGLVVSKPFSGEMENLGRGVSYCATCDGAFYRGKTAIVIGYSKEDEKEVDFLAELAQQVTYLPMYEGEIKVNATIDVMRNVKPVSIEKAESGIRLLLENGMVEADGIFLLRECVAPSQLVPGVQIDKNLVVVDRLMRTNIPGLFACGDITGAPYQYSKAAGEGNVAALSAVDYLAR